MSRKHIEEIYCDRCGKKHERKRHGGFNFRTMEIGWFLYKDGSGSKTSTSDDRFWSNLDFDLCNTCTEEFLTWWKEGGRKGVKIEFSE